MECTNNDNKLRQFKRYLRDKGARRSTVDDYLSRVEKYFKFCVDKDPSPEMAKRYRDHLLDRNLSNSSVANYSFGIKKFQMLSQDIKFLHLKRANEIPYFFPSSEVNRIFDQTNNIKHLAMFKMAFYACLRASELCNLIVNDINLDSLALVIRNGKKGKTSVCYLSEEVIETLQEYLAVRPDFELEVEASFFHRLWRQIRPQRDLPLSHLLQRESGHQEAGDAAQYQTTMGQKIADVPIYTNF